MQKLVIIKNRHVTIQTVDKIYSDNLDNYLIDGGFLPIKAVLLTENGQAERPFISLDCNLDTGDCWKNDQPFQNIPENDIKTIFSRIDQLISAKQTREEALAREENERIQKEALQAEQQRLASMTPEEKNVWAIEQAKVERSIAVSEITVEVDGMVFDGDEKAQERMSRTVAIATANGMPMTTETTWVLADNTIAQVTLQQLTQACLLAGQKQTELWTRPYEQA